jgi:hypothetical protein
MTATGAAALERTALYEGNVSERATSALCQKRTLKRLRPMSALPPKADIQQHDLDVRFVPLADSPSACRSNAETRHRPLFSA